MRAQFEVRVIFVIICAGCAETREELQGVPMSDEIREPALPVGWVTISGRPFCPECQKRLNDPAKNGARMKDAAEKPAETPAAEAKKEKP